MHNSNPWEILIVPLVIISTNSGIRSLNFNLPRIYIPDFPKRVAKSSIFCPLPINILKAAASSNGSTSFLCKFSVMAISIASSSDSSRTITGIFFKPAITDALYLRSPHTISYLFFPFGLTTIGCNTPCSFIEAASSLRASSENVFRGLNPEGLIFFNSMFSIIFFCF